MNIAFDLTLRRPGCVLIQASYGCAEATELVKSISPELWLTAPTANMKVYDVPPAEAATFAEDCNRWHARGTVPRC